MRNAKCQISELSPYCFFFSNYYFNIFVGHVSPTILIQYSLVLKNWIKYNAMENSNSSYRLSDRNEGKRFRSKSVQQSTKYPAAILRVLRMLINTEGK